jgi:hypothetical protein
MAEINYPYGPVGTITIAATGTSAVAITDSVTMVDGLTTLTGNATLDVTVDEQVKKGAMLHLKVKTTATETFTFGTGINAPTVTGVAGKTWCQSFWYDGTDFLPCGAKIQID